ncbi:MAG: aldehyde dehydrogenase [Christensenellales bacterium]|jgi:aldehyde dehydrogenase (NAD+)
MNQSPIKSAVAQAREFFGQGRSLKLSFRLAALKKLEETVIRRQKDILTALGEDLNKSPYEGFMAEVGLVLGEISLARRKLRRWARPQRCLPSLAQLPATARVHKQPYGVALVMSPWNYPFQLTLIPLIGAVAAGNCAIVKPSAYAPATSQIIADICAEAFEPGHVRVIQGGREENSALLEEQFDYIFFTGSPRVGQLVMEKAAAHLTPLTLELGGKSPVIVEESADLALTARRILFGKLINAGQTCVAPDYVLAHHAIKDQLVEALKRELARMMPDAHYFREAYPKIINQKHFERLTGLLAGQTILAGGALHPDTRQISLALVDEPAPDSPLMQEEIFGPILPILSVSSLEEAMAFVAARPHPLALYLFTRNRESEDKVIRRLHFGGGCVNDTVLHLAGAHLPFGGVGNSGMGRYHGKASFDTFSHHKSVMKKWAAPDMPLRYHPYKNPEKPLPGWLLKR